MSLSKRFANFLGISFSCVALLIPKRFICFGISSAVIGSKDYILYFLTGFLYFSTVFLIASEMLLQLQKYLSSTLVSRFVTISIKNVLKMLVIWYSFFINFLCNISNISIWSYFV